MILKNNKKLLAIIIIIVILLILTLFLYIYTTIDNKKEETKQEEQKKEEIVYPIVEDSPETILKTVYNDNAEIYANGYQIGPITESIFGNTTEKPASLLSPQYKMSIALYNFDISKLETIKCNEIPNSKNWQGVLCGGVGNDNAYKLPVQDLNSKVSEVFNEDIDYNSFDTYNLTIGTCAGGMMFKYVEDLSIYVSVLHKGSCPINNKIEITNVTKTQDKDLVTLDVYYKIAKLNAGKKTFSNTKQDKFYFKVLEDGTYYFYSSIAYVGTVAPIEEE